MSEIKIIRINDYITIPFQRSKVQCPISRINMTVEDLREVMESRNAPSHIYALMPSDLSKSVLITKKNYMKSNRELFSMYYETKEEKKTVNVQVEVPKVFSVDSVVESSPVEIETTEPVVEVTETPVVEVEAPAVNEPVVTNKEESNDEFLAGGNAASFADEVVKEEKPDTEETIEIGDTSTDSETIEISKTETETPVQPRQNNYNNNRKKKHK